MVTINQIRREMLWSFLSITFVYIVLFVFMIPGSTNTTVLVIATVAETILTLAYIGLMYYSLSRLYLQQKKIAQDVFDSFSATVDKSMQSGLVDFHHILVTTLRALNDGAQKAGVEKYLSTHSLELWFDVDVYENTTTAKLIDSDNPKAVLSEETLFKK